MAKAYFIGGAPRVGKSTLLLEFVKANPMLSLSTDGIRYVLRQVVDEKTAPDLFAAGRFTGDDPKVAQEIFDQPQNLIDLQNRESEVVWRSIADYVRSELSDGRDVVVEGIAVLPELLVKLDVPYACVFVGNASSDHDQIIYQSARANDYDWLHHLPDETIRAFSAFSREFSAHIRQEAARHNMPYIEMSDADFQHSLKQALDALRA